MSADRLTRRFGGLVANHNVSLELCRGEVHALVGPNGAGKSTFINMMAGALPPTSGRILLNGRDITGMTVFERSRVGVGRSFQHTNIFPEFSVFENCRLAAQSRRQHAWRILSSAMTLEHARERAHRVIAQVGLGGCEAQIARTLSHGGQRQLELAMVLATDPVVLLLDEPLAGMGAEESARMVELLRQLRGDHAILLVEHDMDAVFSLADVITVLVNGERLATARPEQIRNSAEVREAYLGNEKDEEKEESPHKARASAEPMLEASALHSYYGESHVLRGVDFRIHRGETVALMGRNGMGKSTLLKSLLGIVRPRMGTVAIWGKDFTRADVHSVMRQGVAYVPEGRGIFPNLTVLENLVMSARTGHDGSCHWTLERVLAAFPRLKERLRHGGGQLSGGEQQMLSIGRALMTNPQLLILDEATEGLAPGIAKEIWSIIRQIRATGIATVLVDKNFSAVLRLAHRAVILVKGEVIFEGTGAELRSRPDLIRQHLGV